jgi:hypothetical protein
MAIRKKIQNKKGLFFTLDALLALFLLFSGLMIISNMYISTQPRTQLSYYSQDIISLFSEVKVNELNNSMLEELITNGNITDMDYSILEQIGIFWVTNKTSLATSLAKNLSYNLIPERFGYSFIVDGDIVYNKTKLNNKELVTHKSMITGIEKSRPIKGTSVRIILSQIANTLTTRYAFLGGFVGQGNISTYVLDIPSDANITEMFLEVDAGNNFSLDINNIFCDSFSISLINMSSDAWDISYCNSSINLGMDNNFTFRFDGNINTSFIGGGFIKISYLTKNAYLKNTSSHIYNFPGIDGIVNLFDGFVVPGTLNNMEIFLHYLANHSNISNNTFYLTIGNQTVYRDNSSNSTVAIYINNSVISSILNYTHLSNQTVPLRVGFENLSYEYVISDKGNGDVSVITDVSGSMEWEFDTNNDGEERFCRNIDLNNLDSMRLATAKCILKDFAHNILYNITGNRVGLVAYDDNIRSTLNLDTNLTEITNEVNQYYADDATCTSCGVVGAANQLLTQSVLDLLNKNWKYTNDNQTVDPVGWTSVGFDDSTWLDGYQKFGFGMGSDYYTGNVIFADLGDHPLDTPAPVDFTTQIYYTSNTFGLITIDTIENLLSNSFYSGPSLSSWTQNGAVTLSPTTTILYDDFEDGNLNGWITHAGNHGAPNVNIAGQSTLVAGNFGIRMRGGNDWDNNAGVGTTSNGDPWIERAFDLSSYNGVRVSYSRASTDTGFSPHEAGEDFRFEWTTNNFGAVTQEENIEMRNNLEDFASTPIWSRVSYDLPPGALNANFELRFSSDGSWYGEYSYIDNILIQSTAQNPFGLDEYWFSNSSDGNIGYISQQFTSSSATPNLAELEIIHSINQTYFGTDANVFCNLTHPGGENIVWNENWLSAAPPVEGPTTDLIDITGFITSDTFNYEIECGVIFSGVGESLVAFDNISVNINWTNDGNDGWDWDYGTFGFNNDVSFYPDSNKEIELVVNNSNANSVSGAYGIQINITQEMIDVMNSAGGSAYLSFDYRWDPRDDGSAGLFETTDQIWIKGYFESTASGQHYLGTEMNNEGGDGTIEIWTANDPDTEGYGFYSNEISAWIDNGPGNYYLALGGKLLRNSVSEFGAFSFDNIQLAFTNNSGNTFYRNEFFIRDLNYLFNPMSLSVTTDGGADIYLNGNLLDNYNIADSARNIPIVAGNFRQGDNVLAIKLKNADGVGRLSVQFEANITDRQKAMLIMSDGEANYCAGIFGAGADSGCNDCGGGTEGCCPGADGIIDEPCPDIPELAGCSDRDAKEQLVNLSCYYHKTYNISLYSVAFGDVSTCGKIALNLSALCDSEYTPTEPHYFESDNPEGLSNIYGQIANELRLFFSVKKSQIISFEGEFEKSFLYPDSYISLNYTPIVKAIDHGEFPLFFETQDFGNCTYEINIPSQIRILEANLLTYSAEHWTDYVSVQNSLGTMVAFNLSRFNTNYANLGDPFPIPIPGSYFSSGEINTISINTGDNPYNSTNCSTNTSLLYTGLLNIINYTQPYSNVYPNATGCNWTIEHEMGYNFSLNVPTDYSGTDLCSYTNTSHNITNFDNEDSFNWAMYNFLGHLDVNDDGKVFLNLNEEEFVVSSRVIRDVPYLWGPTIAEVRVWQ